jgi:hypothetical protein
MLGCLTATVIAGAILLEVRVPAAAQETGGLPALAQRVERLEFKLGPVHLVQLPGACPEVVFSGVNVRIVNGMGSTETTNGCGNLIVGYNESRPAGAGSDVRTGSHNIIVGQQDNYSSFGGLIAGLANASLADYASVSGGNGNSATGRYSTIGGGFSNTASGQFSAVSGGNSSSASGDFSSVSGGVENVAGGFGSSVGGGQQNNASGVESSISGGFRITQDAAFFGWSAGSFGDAISGSFRSP